MGAAAPNTHYDSTNNKCRLTGISAEESLTQRPQPLIGAPSRVSRTS